MKKIRFTLGLCLLTAFFSGEKMPGFVFGICWVFVLFLVCGNGFAQPDRRLVKHSSMIEGTLGLDLGLNANAIVTYKQYLSNRFCAAAQYNLAKSFTGNVFNNQVRGGYFNNSLRFGMGCTFGNSRTHHTLLALAGLKHFRYRETLNFPALPNETTRVTTWLPDGGLMYSFKRGKGRNYFVGQLFVPLLPWKGFVYSDNITNFSVGFGLGRMIE